MRWDQALVWVFCTPLGWIGIVIFGTIFYKITIPKKCPHCGRKI